ncbi:MAG: hypothetical protein V3W44_10825 [Dehalococcoidales bacterium]
MSGEFWVAFAGLCFVVLSAAVHVGRKIGELPGLLAEAMRNHEKGCVNYEEKELTSPKIEAVK